MSFICIDDGRIFFFVVGASESSNHYVLDVMCLRCCFPSGVLYSCGFSPTNTAQDALHLYIFPVLSKLELMGVHKILLGVLATHCTYEQISCRHLLWKIQI